MLSMGNLSGILRRLRLNQQLDQCYDLLWEFDLKAVSLDFGGGGRGISPKLCGIFFCSAFIVFI